jgi:hypothetical protein
MLLWENRIRVIDEEVVKIGEIYSVHRDREMIKELIETKID